MSNSKPYKLIDQDLNIQTRGFVDYLRTARFNLTVCIIGSQSSGKSTLLNKMLESEVFQVMNARGGYRQTTQGIDIVSLNDWFVMDFEGSDSAERDEKEQVAVQYKFGLYALLVTEVVMLNVMSN